jgi:hypothetical protein
MRTIRLPGAARNPVSLLGMAVATAMAVLFVVLFLLELFGYLTNPYIGLLVFVAVPACFVLGLLLIPIGAWWTTRRRPPSSAPPDWPVVDLRNAHTRTVVLSVFALTIVNVVIVSLAAYGGVHHMESTAFCAQTCHTTMEPQAVAHAFWPHANVACTACHVGPGAGAFVEGKLAGTRQLFQVITGRVPRPVTPPDRLIQPALVTCLECHSNQRGSGDTLRAMREYASDEANTETVTTMRMHVGAIHRHLNLEIDYPADDQRKDVVSWVRVRYPDGAQREFRTGQAGEVEGQQIRRMDCLDCHNRPAHTFSFTPERAVDAALARGQIPRELAFVRQQALVAVAGTYPDRAAALEAIAAHLRDFYASRPATENRLLERAVAGTQTVWAQNVFPAMSVRWGTYPNALGHVDTPGCFRCHDDGHKAADGAVISQDCELCHTLPE